MALRTFTHCHSCSPLLLLRPEFFNPYTPCNPPLKWTIMWMQGHYIPITRITTFGFITTPTNVISSLFIQHRIALGGTVTGAPHLCGKSVRIMGRVPVFRYHLFPIGRMMEALYCCTSFTSHRMMRIGHGAPSFISHSRSQ
jgi:hypothetical protein